MTETFNEKNFCGNRIVALKALTGSHNYNLHTENSDRDYKYFVYPTFEDLYESRMFANSVNSPMLDATCHDVRQLVELVWKANINFIEVLYSADMTIDPELEFMVNHRDEFARMNEYAFFKATYGMHLQKMAGLYKGTATTSELVEKYGYDTKQACHAYRCLLVLSRYMETQDMGESIWFNGGSEERWALMNIKNGMYTETMFRSFITAWHEEHKENAEKWYRAAKPNSDWYEHAKEVVKGLVKEKLLK